MFFVPKQYLKTPFNDISNVHQQFGKHDKQRNSRQARQVDIRLKRPVVINYVSEAMLLSS